MFERGLSDRRAVDLHDRVAGDAPAARGEADDGKENGAERRDGPEVLGHDAGTLADIAAFVLKEFLKTLLRPPRA